MKNNKILNDPAQRALEVFCRKFAPARDEADATHFYTTEEIGKALTELAPAAAADANQIYEILYPLGYRPTIDSSHFRLNYKWMLKKAPDTEKRINLEENIVL